MIEIERNSPAWRELAEAFADADTRKVSLDVRGTEVAVKVNEHMWSPALRGAATTVTGPAWAGARCPDCSRTTVAVFHPHGEACPHA
jgi:hypothetical protein